MRRVQIQYAIFDEKTINIYDIHEDNRNFHYTCPKCEKPLIPRIGKAKNNPHFLNDKLGF